MIELKGKPVSDKIFQELTEKVKKWSSDGVAVPHLAVVLVGDDPASSVYVGHKQKACETLGFKSTLIRMSTQTTTEDLQKTLDSLNDNPTIDAILLQLPLPAHLDSFSMTNRIQPLKDADGLTSASLGLLVSGKSVVKSCTPSGIIEILKHYNISVSGQSVLVIGRSQIVGLPLFHLLNSMNATVTLAHSKTPDLKKLVQQFDYVFVATGQRQFLKATDFKKAATVIDVGIHRTEKGLQGDVDPTGAVGHLKALTPVPGGVGPTTIALLMQNTFLLAEQRRKLKV